MKHSGFLWSVILVVALIVPVAALVVVGFLLPDSLAKNSAKPAAITMPVTSQTDAQAVAAQAQLTWAAGPSLLAPDWSGLVTQLDVKAGSQIVSGTTLVHIDGTPRVALASATPFYRSLNQGISGPDVQMLRDALNPLPGTGWCGQGDTYDAALQKCVTGFQITYLGMSKADADGTFDPSMVVYLPVPSLVAGKIDATVGTMPPDQGQPVVEAASTLQPFSLGPMADSSGNPGTPLPSTSKGFEFIATGGPTLAVGKGFKISSAAALAAVTKANPSQPTSITGQVQLVKPETFSVVPVSSIVTSTNGGYCVFQSGANDSLIPHTVKPGGGLPGETEVTGLPSSIASVVANPSQLGLVECAKQ